MADVSVSTSSSSLLSGSIKWSGLASGVDFSEVVDQLVEIEKTNMYRLESWRKEWVAKNESIDGLNQRMNALEINAKELDTFSEFYSRTSTSSNTSVVSATNTSTAELGSHTIVVGSDIQGKVISTSYLDGTAVGGTGNLVITVGDKILTIPEGDGTGGTWDPTADINALAQQILDADVDGILADVSVVADKTRGADITGGPGDYKRLVITAALGGSANAITVSDPTNLSMDASTFDQPLYTPGSGWLSDTNIESQGTYTGHTNKTFTFRIASTGVLGVDEVTIAWADSENNSGTVTVTDLNDYYEVAQGLEIRFTSTGGNDRVFENDAFTVDCFAPTLQAAQDTGIALAEKRVHEGFKDLITPITDSNEAVFEYQYAGETFSVKVPGSSKLQGLVDAINEDPNNAHVKATIVDDGQGTSQSYHLVLTGNETGAEHTIRITNSTLTNFSATDGDFEFAQRASNAMIKLDGYPSDASSYLQRSTNTISDVADGLVLEIHDAGQAIVNVSNDIDTVMDKIDQFVQSINFVLDYIRQETAYDADSEEKGVMIGNYTYDIVRNALNSAMFSSIPGLDRDEDPYTILAQIGIESDPDQDGMWVVDSTTLRNALITDMEAVARLFVADEDHEPEASTGVADIIGSKMEEFTNTSTGLGYVLINNYNEIIAQIDNKLASEERRITLVQTRLEEKFARLETVLSELEGESSYLESQLEKLPDIGA